MEASAGGTNSAGGTDDAASPNGAASQRQRRLRAERWELFIFFACQASSVLNSDIIRDTTRNRTQMKMLSEILYDPSTPLILMCHPKHLLGDHLDNLNSV